MSLPAPSDPSVFVRAVSQLAPRSITWLWPGRLALGKLAILDGDPGLGKSLVALDLCARLSTGQPLPDGSTGPGPCAAVYLNGEDGPADTVRPRLESLGADLARVFVPHQEDADLLRLPSQASVLEAAVAQTGARLAVIDPILAFLEPSVLSGNDQSVRQALAPLAQLAQKHACAVLLVRHLNKRSGQRSVYRGEGSIGFLAACRSGWLIAPDPEALGRRVLAQQKNNLAPPQPSLAYEVVAQDGAAPRIAWLGPSPWTADQLVARGAAPKPQRPRLRAQEFLTAFLKDGPRSAREIWQASREQGLAVRTLRRAKKVLEIRTQRVCVDGRQLNYWLLPGQQLPACVLPEAMADGVEPWLAALRERFPPSTPLDEI